jgi:hypothetical protein
MTPPLQAGLDRQRHVNESLECFTLEYGADRLSRNVGEQLPTYAALTAHKSEDLTYTAAEA